MLECKCWTAGGGGVALGPTALGAVVAGDIAANAVTGLGAVAVGAVDAGDIAANAVTELTGTGTGA